MNQQLRVLYCECAEASAVSPRAKDAVCLALDEAGLRADRVADLCGLAARKSPLLQELAAATKVAIAACHPRAVKWLFAAGGAPLRDEHVTYLDMREGADEELRQAIHGLAAGAAGPAGSPSAEQVTATELDVPAPGASPSGLLASSAWKPWFPVIDVERCNSCRQCVGFCLFGVYGVDRGGSVQVKNPSRCKNGCPACSRLCPTEAIIFPKYPSAPINGGVAVAGAPQLEPVRVDRAALLGNDPLAALRDRNKRDLLMSLPPDQLLAVRERFAHLATAPSPGAVRHESPAPLPASNEPT